MGYSHIVADTIQEFRVRPERREVGPHKPGTNGFGLCPECGRPVHGVLQWTRKCANGGKSFVGAYLRHNPIPRLRVIEPRDRTHCSSCNKPGEWYTFDSAGRCVECAP